MVVLVTTATPVSAHVSVRADNPVRGGFTKLTFRAPSESSEHSTTELKISIPQQPPVLFVRVRPHPGWKVETERKKLDHPQTFDGEKVDSLVTDITLKADEDEGIPPRQFDEFDLTAGPLPDVHALEFPVRQEYDDGRKVSWDEPWSGPAHMPRHPVPRIVLGSAAHESQEPAAADPLARWLGGGGLCLAAVAFGAALLLRRRPGGPERI